MSIIQAAGSGEVSTGFYKHLLDQSIKLNDDDSSYLKRTPASAGNQKTWTWSAWVKRGNLGITATLFSTATANDAIYFGSGSSNLTFYTQSNYWGQTAASFRDTSAWYHIVCVWDTSNSTAADRLIIYVNSERQELEYGANPALNATSGFNNNVVQAIGRTQSSANGYFDGYIAEVNFIDGAALTPASFGETKDGIWTPKDTSGLTFGTNGFHLTFKDDVVSEGFNAVTWRGSAADNSISGIGFSPAFVWIKDRTDATANYLFDVNRGALKDLYSNLTAAEYSAAQTLKSFDGDGFTLGNNTGVNGSADDMVAWCWEGGGTPTATNSAGAGATPTAGSVKIDGSNLGSALAGTIPATKISANTARGFSIVGYEATGTAGTIAHGLSAAPELIICKHRDQSGTSWPVYYGDNTDAMYLNDSGATSDDANAWNDTTPTSTVFSVGANGGDTNNTNGASTIAYCFHSVSGYSKIGTFTGNGGSQAIDVGFEPAFVLMRRTSGSTWGIFDNLRGNSGSDRNLQMLAANSTATETTNSQMTFSGNTFNDNGYLSDNGTTVLYMAFADTREAAFFKDVTTNGNHFVPVNLDYRDSVPDVPTNNFAVGNPLSSTSNNTFAEGNLKVTGSGVNYYNYLSSMAMPTGGKYYFEVYSNRRDSSYWAVGICKPDVFTHGMSVYNTVGSMALQQGASVYYLNSTVGSTTNRYNSTAYIFNFAIDLDNNLFHFRVDGGTWENSGDPAAGSGGYAIASAMQGITLIPWFGPNGANIQILNFGQDSSFGGLHATANSNADGNGHGSFAYAPPSGFLALCSQNLPNVDIIDGTDNFNTVLYTGTGSSHAITGVGFSPDFTWIRKRNSGTDHQLVNSVVGYPNGTLLSNATDAEYTDAARVDSADADGFTVSSPGQVNANTDTFVAWNWLAGTAFSNDASATSVGTIDSEGQVNTKAGFAILKWAGTGSNGTLAHGLTKAPELIIVKNRDAADEWPVLETVANGGTHYLRLNSTAASTSTSSMWNNTNPTDSVFSLGTYEYVNASGENYISYIFHSVEGYSKVGTYEGNANNDGTFVYTGFRPAFLLVKSVDSTSDWLLVDDKRIGYNPQNEYIEVNNANTEGTVNMFDLVSNGFKNRDRTADPNVAETYLYIAFASQPFKFSNAR